jgi:putative membrane protein
LSENQDSELNNRGESSSEVDREEHQQEREKMQKERQEWAEERTEWAEERTEQAEQRTEWAEQRTDWAQHRTVLANERTFSAWLRTGLSAIGGGVAIVEFLGNEDGELIARILGVILILVGAGVILLAFWRYNQISNLLEEKGLPVTPKWMVLLLTGGLLAAVVLVLILIFIQ